MIPNATTRSDILDAISDDYSFRLLEAIAVNGIGEDLAETLQMSRKQFYSRVAKLIKVDLIRRRHRKYILTPFGKLIYSVQISLSKAVENRWKFKAIESIRDNKQLSPRQYLGMINLLLDDMDLKEIIINKRGALHDDTTLTV